MAAGRAIAEQRDAMVARWMEWLGDRVTGTPAASREVAADEFRLILDTFAVLVGPLRREARPIWLRVAEQYGRQAAARGLAAGEVVEEMQYLRELLIRYLSPAIAAARPRQGMALLLRLNRLVDRGVAMAVVGYTDAIVATLLPQGDGRRPPTTPDPDEARLRFASLRGELQHVIAAGDGTHQKA